MRILKKLLVVFDSLVLFLILDDRESGEPSKRKSYLPSEKQFLITRNGKIKDLRVLFTLLSVLCFCYFL